MKNFCLSNHNFCTIPHLTLFSHSSFTISPSSISSVFIHNHTFPFASFTHLFTHQTQSYFSFLQLGCRFIIQCSYMEAVEGRSSSGYGKPPWVFRGSAWYQLHLVKAEKARAYIPKEFKLVEAFGYTLGGFFLASYEDSPVGVFDEDLYGTAQHPARGGPSKPNGWVFQGHFGYFAYFLWPFFKKTITAISRQPSAKKSEFLHRIGIGAKFSSPKDPLNVEVTKIKCADAEEACNINISLTSPVPSLSFDHRLGPKIRMSLPSFSGATEYNPNLLKYSCQIECRVQALKPLKVSQSFTSTNDGAEQILEDHGRSSSLVAENHKTEAQNFSTCVMLSKPLLALKFSQMKMQVEAPLVLSQCSNSLQNTKEKSWKKRWKKKVWSR
ncbi:protein NEOXANTHIN-DEFICIENT 1 isoform X2 [Vigna angularis]|uniref:protein NEOXANTHIN-DEFICIENT 1 isoform X2 n=1 Tax=Phaseolus angularis TaxID=3914 RepID=UPI0022B4841D|nr:protein NEOXANTHIN-DEFICIENT 1 isoform X2 [Vigna angularis]